MYGEGISYEGNLIDLGVEAGLITKSGAYFSYGEERLGQGRNAAKVFLREHTDIAEELDARIREHHGVKAPSDAEFEVTTTALEVEDPEEALTG
jgi:recombination protein RecA